jgi:thymidylate synthase (FAD)
MGITVACGYIPHSLMQQLRTHRIAVTFDVMSFRYNSEGIINVANGQEDLEKIFYLRPLGNYSDRKGKKYEYRMHDRLIDANWCKEASIRYKEKIEYGFSEEHARGQLPFDMRQHFVLSFNNLRSLWHMLDLRWKADAQLEAQWFCDLLWEATKDVAPSLTEWYASNRAKKAKLAP